MSRSTPHCLPEIVLNAARRVLRITGGGRFSFLPITKEKLCFLRSTQSEDPD